MRNFKLLVSNLAILFFTFIVNNSAMSIPYKRWFEKYIHRLCAMCIYGKFITSCCMVRKWITQFNEGSENVYDEPWCGHRI